MDTLRSILPIFLLTFTFSTNAQSNKPLELIEVFISDSSQLRSPSDFTKKDSAFFQDNKYIVKATCHGEWGGSVWFKNKKTLKEHGCRATCPVIINKIGSTYYVTINSFHMVTSTGVIEIDNPELMPISNSTKPKLINGYSLAPIESDNFKKGKTLLADSQGVYSITSFVLQNKLYHLIRNSWNSKIYISTIQKKHFEIIDSLPNGSLLNFTNHFATLDGHYVMFFDSDLLNGYIDIFGNKIIIFRFDHLHGRRYDAIFAWQQSDLQKQRYRLLIDTFYNKKFDKAGFPKNFNTSNTYNVKVNVESIYQAIFNSDSSKFIAFYLDDEKKDDPNYPNQYQAKNMAVWGKKNNNNIWDYTVISYGIHIVQYVNNTESMQRYNFNHLQEWNFFEENSIKLNSAFWESSYFKEMK